jgi:hypothetical protein
MFFTIAASKPASERQTVWRSPTLKPRVNVSFSIKEKNINLIKTSIAVLSGSRLCHEGRRSVLGLAASPLPRRSMMGVPNLQVGRALKEEDGAGRSS